MQNAAYPPRTVMHRKKGAHRDCGEAIAASIEERIGLDRGIETRERDGMKIKRPGQRGSSEGSSDMTRVASRKSHLPCQATPAEGRGI